MKEQLLIQEKSQNIRDVIHYLKLFDNSLVIIYLDNELIDSPIFTNHIRDICLIHDAGLRVIIVPGSAKRINEVLEKENIEWYFKDGCRITNADAIPLIKMATFDVSNKVMTALAAEKKTAIIGNWVRARGKGVINGFDFENSGEIDKLDVEAINTILDNKFIPIFPCIGWSLTGKPYNISSQQLAEQISVHLKADKLFYLIPEVEINRDTMNIPASIMTTDSGTVPAINQKDIDDLILNNPNGGKLTTEQSLISVQKDIISLLKLSKHACQNGVSRVHLLNGSLEGCIPCEIFSDLGSGTMIYHSDYDHFRNMTKDDVTSVFNLIQPFVQKEILLPRSIQFLNDHFEEYTVYEIDGSIRACASLIPYDDGQAEIACVAVSETYGHFGIGKKLIDYLLNKAKSTGKSTVFLLTTKTSDFFENLGFTLSTIDSLPDERKKIWTPNRASKVLRKDL